MWMMRCSTIRSAARDGFSRPTFKERPAYQIACQVASSSSGNGIAEALKVGLRSTQVVAIILVKLGLRFTLPFTEMAEKS